MINTTVSAIVNNETIRFASCRPPRSGHALLDRNIRVTGPETVIQFLQNADLDILPGLIEMLKDPAKAWAAEIILTSITGNDGKVIESFAGDIEKWWEYAGMNAFKKWHDWYSNNKVHLVWNKEKMQVELNK